MIQLLTSLVGILLVFSSVNHAQFNPDWCAGEPSEPVIDPKWQTIAPRFEILTELIGSDGVMEIFQAFSTTRDSVAKKADNISVSYYWDFSSKEYLKVSTNIDQRLPKCSREVITTDSQTSIIGENTLYLKPSIILGFDSLNKVNPLWGIRYEGPGSLRDIPTAVFKSCFNVSDINATVKVTYHVSDVNKFQAYLPINESIILQLDVNITNTLEHQQAYTYNVFGYFPNPSRRQERQALEVPGGVYCPDRTSAVSVPPNIPDRVSSNAEASVPTADNSSIFSSHSLFDTEYQFSRVEYWYSDQSGRSEWIHRTEMNDFAVGLSYQFDHASRRCTVNDISLNTTDAIPAEDDSNLVQMGDSQHIFLMDDMTYQYTGEKQCRDRVLCNVWIGENQLGNGSVQHREWYWATRVNNAPLTNWIPMKLITKRYESDSLVFALERTFFNYRRNPMTIFEIDYTLADCYRALGPTQNFNLGVLSFTIANDKQYPVFQNLNFLRLHIWETLIFTMFIRPIRISNLIVDQDGNDIIVTFTLLDAAPRTGPVEVPLIESSLDTLIGRLTSIIDSNGLAFRAKYDAKTVVLRARPNSLNIAHRSKEEKSLSSGPLITGLWIGCAAGGLLIGTVGGFFLFHKLAKK